MIAAGRAAGRGKAVEDRAIRKSGVGGVGGRGPAPGGPRSRGWPRPGSARPSPAAGERPRSERSPAPAPPPSPAVPAPVGTPVPPPASPPGTRSASGGGHPPHLHPPVPLAPGGRRSPASPHPLCWVGGKIAAADGGEGGGDDVPQLGLVLLGRPHVPPSRPGTPAAPSAWVNMASAVTTAQWGPPAEQPQGRLVLVRSRLDGHLADHRRHPRGEPARQVGARHRPGYREPPDRR